MDDDEVLEQLTDIALKYARKLADGNVIHFLLIAHEKSLCGISDVYLHKVTEQELGAFGTCHDCFITSTPKEPDFDKEDIAYEDKVVDEHELYNSQ